MLHSAVHHLVRQLTLTVGPIIAKPLKSIAVRHISPNFHFAIPLSRATFALGMNLSLAAKRMTTSTSSIISTTTKSITANGEARN